MCKTIQINGIRMSIVIIIEARSGAEPIGLGHGVPIGLLDV
jgi:hypothetical protein